VNSGTFRTRSISSLYPPLVVSTSSLKIWRFRSRSSSAALGGIGSLVELVFVFRLGKNPSNMDGFFPFEDVSSAFESLDLPTTIGGSVSSSEMGPPSCSVQVLFPKVRFYSMQPSIGAGGQAFV